MISSLGHVGMSKENGMASANVEKEVIGAFGEWWDEEQQQKATLFGSDFITIHQTHQSLPFQRLQKPRRSLCSFQRDLDC